MSAERRPRRRAALALTAAALITGGVVATPLLVTFPGTSLASPHLASGPATASAPRMVTAPTTAATPPARSGLTGYSVVGPRPRPARAAVIHADEIPAPAAAAYQRAASIMRQADSDCGLAWPLLAAVGWVASDHGRHQGGGLDRDGVAVPRLVGRTLTGEDGTPASDTDAGALDGDPARDRTVGPLALAPTTWLTVRVDADGDGKRDPQDVDDAALATAVLLCGTSGLDDRARVTASLARLNTDPRFAPLVRKAEAVYRTAGLTPPAVRTAPLVVAPPPAVAPPPPVTDRPPRWKAEQHSFPEGSPTRTWAPVPPASPWGRPTER